MSVMVPDEQREKLMAQLPATVHGLVWYERDEQIWRGFVREFSLFAEGPTAVNVRQKLQDSLYQYIQDALLNDAIESLIPRPVPHREWYRLKAHLTWLRLMSNVGRWTGRSGPDGGAVRHVPLYCP